MRKIINEGGFTAFDSIITVVALVAIGVAGYFAYQARHAAVALTATRPEVTVKTSRSPTPSPTPSSSVTPTHTTVEATAFVQKLWDDVNTPSNADNFEALNAEELAASNAKVQAYISAPHDFDPLSCNQVTASTVTLSEPQVTGTTAVMTVSETGGALGSTVTTVQVQVDLNQLLLSKVTCPS
jgi:hypothetical protein